MERETNPQSTVLCRMGCGFYGNPAFEGMCSKCYKDSLKRKQPSPPLSGRTSPSPGSSSSMSSAVSSSQPCPAAAAPTTIAIPKLDTETTASTHTSCVTAAASPEKTLQVDTSESDLNSSSQSLPSGSEVTESPDGKSKKRNRCTSCRKKVGLTGFECRCGGLFCGLHRYSDKHDCSYDYKADAREMIAKQNPVVVGEKVKKI